MKINVENLHQVEIAILIILILLLAFVVFFTIYEFFRAWKVRSSTPDPGKHLNDGIREVQQSLQLLNTHKKYLDQLDENKISKETKDAIEKEIKTLNDAETSLSEVVSGLKNIAESFDKLKSALAAPMLEWFLKTGARDYILFGAALLTGIVGSIAADLLQRKLLVETEYMEDQKPSPNQQVNQIKPITEKPPRNKYLQVMLENLNNEGEVDAIPPDERNEKETILQKMRKTLTSGDRKQLVEMLRICFENHDEKISDKFVFTCAQAQAKVLGIDQTIRKYGYNTNWVPPDSIYALIFPCWLKGVYSDKFDELQCLRTITSHDDEMIFYDSDEQITLNNLKQKTQTDLKKIIEKTAIIIRYERRENDDSERVISHLKQGLIKLGFSSQKFYVSDKRYSTNFMKESKIQYSGPGRNNIANYACQYLAKKGLKTACEHAEFSSEVKPYYELIKIKELGLFDGQVMLLSIGMDYNSN